MIFRAFSVLSVIMFGLCATEKLDILKTLNYTSSCKRASSDYNSCLKNRAEVIWPIFVKGLPAEFDLPPLDPFLYKYEKVVVDSGDLHGEISVKNITVIGIKMIHFKWVRSHLNDDIFYLGCRYQIPQIDAEGIYEGHGTIAGFRFNTQAGYFNITMKGIRGMWNILGPVKNDTLIVKHFRITPMIKNLKIYVDNSDNSEIMKLANMFVNENWPILYRIILPLAVEKFDTYFSNLVNPFFAKLSFSQIFP
ncbi:uncharacterized protein LOC116849609 [Odontomachus brunneus]|uniref:uncharacterized protein LOC116849609 n=1 Tax=Odontomachus brunneus TaxID=486640 RepID=UPI0013F275A4|nr:uncharacterized protein LOC116849609 [Odontomachus brunneus]